MLCSLKIQLQKKKKKERKEEEKIVKVRMISGEKVAIRGPKTVGKSRAERTSDETTTSGLLVVLSYKMKADATYHFYYYLF